jgi:hypothetical protein
MKGAELASQRLEECVIAGLLGIIAQHIKYVDMFTVYLAQESSTVVRSRGEISGRGSPANRIRMLSNGPRARELRQRNSRSLPQICSRRRVKVVWASTCRTKSPIPKLNHARVVI